MAADWRALRLDAPRPPSERKDDLVFIALTDTVRSEGLGFRTNAGGTGCGNRDGLKDRPVGAATVGATTTAAEGATRITCQGYETFEDLYQYCYLVASVVGLVCIRIFGYTDARAEKLAERRAWPSN